MFNSLQREIQQFVQRGFDSQLRLAVTGLSRSGKTAFITSLINQLLHIGPGENRHLGLFRAAQDGSILAVKRIPQLNLSVPRFDYEANLADLQQNPPQWCQSTRGVSETRLAIRYQRQTGLLRHLKEQATLYLDIVDYPGEWLLDLPLLEMDFITWGQSQRAVTVGTRAQLAHQWQAKAARLDLTAPANEDVLADIAESYTDYLNACKASGMQFIQPGRFVLPGELAGAPALQFFPLLHLSDAQLSQLAEHAKSNSYFALLRKRYDYYRHKIVKRFYQDYFATFDRQVILADCLTPLNHSRQAFIDMQTGLNQLFGNFHYGKRSLLNRLFSPCIDKLLFAASKADHITAEQLPNLVSLMRQLVQQGGRHAAFAGIHVDYGAIAAIRATKQVNVTTQGRTIKALQGIRSRDKKPITLYPGSVPAKLPEAEFWDKRPFEFDSFDPQPLALEGRIPHLRMDAVLQFLLADRLV
ncbi:nucleoside triphosphate hydrolase domain [Haemophilus pittmaniae]|uniref:Nucleoside triphosphate hydrolase domain n=1 Tax=Haemophilus pittmaniae TaxID=249188 RepID=A0A377J2B2_9PAST|nr:YcjX family protein [Haemophilus pittmaniae]STO94010.1 nucleoside triphosphate hydrolase domain [Haemophilus pittmaniae]